MKIHLNLLILIILPLFIQAEESADLTIEQIQAFQNNTILDASSKAIQNALLSKQFSEIFINQEILKHHNTHFTHEIEIGKITDQKKTGRCWLFAGLNTIRPKVAGRLHMKDFEFSENYLFFWDKIEKANTFLELVIARSYLNIRDLKFQRLLSNPMQDGGYWQNFVDLIQKYGCVPHQAMPEFISNENSKEILESCQYFPNNSITFFCPLTLTKSGFLPSIQNLKSPTYLYLPS